jgi:DNA-binding Lrp family transcriptional regulator
MTVTQRDLRLLHELERGLPFVPEPFEEIGKRLGMDGAAVLERIRYLENAGIIRKFRARINQRLIGITANALVAWKAPAEDPDIGPRLAAFPCVTHCYERRTAPGRWEYSFYTVHHGSDRGRVLSEVRSISDALGVSEYEVIFSTEEFKRVPNVRIGETRGSLI